MKDVIQIQKAETKHIHARLQRLMGEAISEFHLLNRGDKVLLGLSGGKDSLALLDLLGERMQRSNHYFTVVALHVRMANISYETDTSYLEEMAARWQIPFRCVETSFEPDRNPKRTPCFLCSWNRRKVLFDQAQAGGFTKIALGHHQDDILQTALMNLTFNGTFSTMAVRMAMRKFPVTIIRPLAKITENEIRHWANLQQYRPVAKVCPYDRETNRTNVQSVVTAMEELNADYRHHLWHALAKAGALIEGESQ